jgi:copper transport protein
MTAPRRRPLAAAALLALLLAAPASALAHAVPRGSSPIERSAAAHPPRSVSLSFTARPDLTLSRVAVVDASGRRLERGPLRSAPRDPRTLRVAVRPLRRGLYTVSWRVVSAQDGHATSGSFSFGVGVSAALARTAPAPSLEARGASPLGIGGRVLLYLGFVALVGVAAVGALVLGAPRPGTARIMAACWAAAAVGTVTVLEVGRRDAGAGLGALLEGSLARAALERGAPLAVALAAIAAAGRTAGGVRRAMVGLAGIGGAGAMLADADLSHAGSGALAALNIAGQWVHALAAGVWIGGLGALLLALRNRPGAESARAVRRFSAMAGVALVAVAGTGVARAVVEVGAWDRLLSTGFGRLIILKVALLAALGLLGAANRLRSVPAAATSLAGLRRIGSVELAIGAGAVIAAAALVNLSPPGAAGTARAAAAPALVASGSDYGTTLRLRLEVFPGRPGLNRFVARLTDFDTGGPVRARVVGLRFALPARPLLGPSALVLAPSADGTYAAAGANLGRPGAWRVTALVLRGPDSVEVPLMVRAAPSGR